MSTVAYPLDLVALVFRGLKSRPFLQGMATNNMDLLMKGTVLPTLFCQYQGKLFASGYLLEQHDDEIWLLSTCTQARLALDHLARYARLSSVTLSIQSIRAEGVVTTDAYPTPLYVLQADKERFSVMVGQHCQLFWSVDESSLATSSKKPVLEWQASLTQAGVPIIGDAVLNRFTPNQLGLVPSDWVRLDKGCYCGQEIIARTFHLGKTQRRLITLHCQLDSSMAFEAGTTLKTASGAKLLLLCVTKIGSGPDALLQVACSADALDIGNLIITIPQGHTIACKQVDYVATN